MSIQQSSSGFPLYHILHYYIIYYTTISYITLLTDRQQLVWKMKDLNMNKKLKKTKQIKTKQNLTKLAYKTLVLDSVSIQRCMSWRSNWLQLRSFRRQTHVNFVIIMKEHHKNNNDSIVKWHTNYYYSYIFQIQGIWKNNEWFFCLWIFFQNKTQILKICSIC